MKIKNKEIVIILGVTIGGVLVFEGTKLINSGLSVLVGLLALAITVSVIITLAIYVIHGIVRAIGRHVHRLRH
ncbi:MAG: hypothetical protein Q8N56_01550 [bacterium]|nr:hypothetical protein [bacterium]